MIEILAAIFASYIITAVLVNGAIFHQFREKFKKHTPWLVKGSMYQAKHLIDCRMCTGFWVSLVVFAVLSLAMPHLSLLIFFLIYGASYFLATQEK